MAFFSAALFRLFRRVELLITLAGLLSLLLCVVLWPIAFPSADLEMEFPKSAIIQKSKAYLEGQGYNLKTYRSQVTFNSDYLASIYLQRTVGIPETNRLLQQEQLPIWMWRVRWFQPGQEEGFFTSLLPNGKLVAFNHVLPMNPPASRLSEDLARKLAETYLTQKQRWAMKDWSLVSSSAETQENGRRDHAFEWKRNKFVLRGGELRLSVTVLGQRVEQYRYYLKVPTDFLERFRKTRQIAYFISELMSDFGFYVFMGAALVAYILAVKHDRLTWKAGLWPGLTVAVVSLLANLNDLFPLDMDYSDLAKNLTFWLEIIYYNLIRAGTIGCQTFILWPGAQQIAKLIWPHQDKVLPRRGDRWANLARSAWRGLMLGGLWGGYLVVFYWVATRLGAWTPLGSPYRGLHLDHSLSLDNTLFPFLSPLEVGLLPAVGEELTYRMVGISLVYWLTRRRWLALLLPGVIWAFAHVGYLREPFYLRGIELSIDSIFAGWVFWRFDLATTIVAHFAYNASLYTWPMLRSGEPYQIISGTIVVMCMVAPFLPAFVRGLRRGTWHQSQPRFELSLARLEDIPALSALPVAGVAWKELLTHGRGAIVCLRGNQVIVGIAAAQCNSDQTADILVVYVDPPWRRQYWGSYLLKALQTQLQDWGIQALRVTIAVDDRPSRQFWANQRWTMTAQTLTTPCQTKVTIVK